MSARETWSGRTGFILATIGSAVGLGSIWKFPYEVGSNGGGAFVLFYLAGLALVVWPLMLLEFALGRRGQADAARGIAAVAKEFGASPRWAGIGVLGTLTSFLILSFYAVIGGWALAYAIEALTGVGGIAADGAAAQARFDALLASPVRLGLHHLLFMVATVAIVALGVRRGIERASEIMMPALALLMAALAVYGAVEGDVGATLDYLFRFDPARIEPRVALEALGLGFFSIGVGLAVMVTYAAYAEAAIDLRQVALITILGDTAISFMAGLAIFPLVFANGLDPAGGPGLMFVSLPVAFAAMPFGGAAALAFFLLLTVAALSSAISMLEMAAAYLRRARQWSRIRAAVVAGAVCWVLGWATVLSFNLGREWRPLGLVPGFEGLGAFELLDQLTSNLLLPLGGLALAILGGWALPHDLLAKELRLGAGAARALRFLLRYFAPAAILATAAAPLLF
ncbi:MAG: sodium-dependent transporter [Alphaproteobacteria bacterium]|nr:sodium-dependent transporter [Alphaproteobacteria bacterium]